MDLLLSILDNLNQILTAGIAITAFSLLFYALTFNLRDRVARSFAFILACVAIGFAGKSLASVTAISGVSAFWLRFQWVGLIFLPASYFHFSDALMAKTGRPSRGRRRLIIRLLYIISLVLWIILPTNLLVGELKISGNLVYLTRTPLTWIFTGYYIGMLAWAWGNFVRAYRRTVTSTSRRRMGYLLTGAIAPPLGSFPYLLFGADFAVRHPLLFWLLAVLSSILVFVFIVTMAYAVAFFGVPWPDRVVKRRLAKWLLRGPVTASAALGLTTFVWRAGQLYGMPDTILVPLVMVAVILLMEHLITIFAPIWETWLFGTDKDSITLLQSLEDRLLTQEDVRQFLEAVLAAVLDQAQSSYAFAAGLGKLGVETVVHVGEGDYMQEENFAENILENVVGDEEGEDILSWGSFWVIPLYELEDLGFATEDNPEPRKLLGVMGVLRKTDQTLDDEQIAAMRSLAERAALVFDDRRLQQQIFDAMENLSPQVEKIQRLRAASRYNRTGVLAEIETLPSAPPELSPIVKDALSHYWGGPKLTESPLMKLQIVQDALKDNEGNPANALRSILKEAIERIRPEGERRFTPEWILYNIMEMKFMEGRKVREVALRLAMSEADLYRKQRVAIEAVTSAIVEMEQQIQDQSNEDAKQTIER